mgnify:CR=1 FL=1
MKKFLALFFVTTFSASSFAQSYSDLFTTYKPAPTVPNGSVYVPKMEVMDPSKYTQKRRSQAEEQLQIITGVYVKNGQFRSIKMKAMVSDLGQVVIKAYYNNQQWWNCGSYASSNPFNVPERLKDMCEYEVYLTGIGKVYF